MPRIKYVEKRFQDKSLRLIEIANQIIVEFTAQGFELTLRQLYYQFVARDFIPNNQKSYDNLGSLINDARLAGLVDWNAIVDRTRNMRKNSHWENPKDFLESVAPQFQLDKWEGQKYRPEVWVEKDALVGVVERVCRKLDVPYFSCRGYTSQSEVWSAAQRLLSWRDDDYTPIIIHLGDHDPSGIDMTRDVTDRLKLFCDDEIEVQRIALNRDQIRKYNPPPNPAKLTDSRCEGYISVHGNQSWELDALNPKIISALIEKAIESLRDDDIYEERVELENKYRAILLKAANAMK
jgi:hypothetical protein